MGDAKDDSVQRTVAFTMALLAIGVVTEGLWQAAIGLWTHMLLYRRPAFGLLEAVYGFSPPAGVAQRPSAEARCEMLLLLAFAPLLVTDIRAPVAISARFGWTSCQSLLQHADAAFEPKSAPG